MDVVNSLETWLVKGNYHLMIVHKPQVADVIVIHKVQQLKSDKIVIKFVLEADFTLTLWFVLHYDKVSSVHDCQGSG